MTDAPTEFRITTLEVMIAELTASVAQTTRNVDRLSAHTVRPLDKTGKTKIRRRGSSSEKTMDFREEMRQERRMFNRELGEIAEKQGRMAEDLVAPSIGRILRQVENYPESMPVGVMVRARFIHPTDPSRLREFDTIATCGDHILINETKSSLEPRDVRKVLKLIPHVRDYFPQYKSKKMICSLATLYVDPSLVTYATRHGILILAVGDELMDVMNPQGFKPREFPWGGSGSFSNLGNPCD